MPNGTLACPLCRGALTSTPQHEHCPRCGRYPVVGDVAVLTPAPSMTLAGLHGQVVKGRAMLEHRRARAAHTPVLVDSDRALIARTLDAMDQNQTLFERLACAAAPPLDSPPAPLSSVFADQHAGWLLDDLLPYFCVDWAAGRAPARDRVADRIRRHAGDSSCAVILGSGGGALVLDAASHFDTVYGIDLALPGLLLARRLLNGDRVEIRLKDAAWRNVVLQGATAGPGRTRLLAGDAASLPLADGSAALVVTQYLLDVIPNPAAVLQEINRVLSPGGIWINEGPPFRMPDPSGLVGPRTVESWPDIVSRFGFDTVEIAAVENAHLDLGHLEGARPTKRTRYDVIAATARKTDTKRSADSAAVAAYFAGDPHQLLSMKAAARTVSVSRSFTLSGDATERSVTLGSTRYPVKDEDSLARVLRFLTLLNGSSPVSQVIETMTTGPDPVSARDAVLALHVLRCRGDVELL